MFFFLSRLISIIALALCHTKKVRIVYSGHEATYIFCNFIHDNYSKGDQHFQAGGNYQSYSDRGYHGYQGQYDRVNDVEISKEIVRIVRHGKYKWIKMDSGKYCGYQFFF